jgi:uncharacterized membrane protein
MEKLFRFILRCCGIGAITITLIVIAYTVGSAVDRKYCYDRLAKEFNVDSDPVEIALALNKKAESILVPGMGHGQVLDSLGQLGTLFVASEMYTLPNGNRGQEIVVRPCTLPNNGFKFWALFSNSEQFIEIRPIYDE